MKLYGENKSEVCRKICWSYILRAFWGGEAVNCLMDFFQEKKLNDGGSKNRIKNNSVFSKTCWGGGRRLTDSKWLIRKITNDDICSVRLVKLTVFHLIFLIEAIVFEIIQKKILSKREHNVKTNHLLFTPNPGWQNNGI